MPTVEIPFGEWLPDRPTVKNPGCAVADNVLPTPGGYGPLPGIQARAFTVSDTVRGSQQFFTSNNSSLIVGGTVDSLFTLRGSVAETSGLTSLGTQEAWDFCQFNDFVIATGDGNSPQYLSDVDSDTTWSDLPGSPPVAKRCARVGDFVMFGSITSAPSRIQWSAFNNPTGSWAASRLTQAGFADLDSSLGEVQRIVGGRYATIFQQRGVSRLSYVGPPVVWRSDIISRDRGAVAPFGVVEIGYVVYFLAQDGFYVTDGSSIQPIGTRRVNAWFFENVDQEQIARVQGAIDWENRCVVWAFNSTSESDYDRVLCYSWEEQRWTSGTLDTQWLVSAKVAGTSIDALDATYGNLDAVPVSLDSTLFQDGERRLAAWASVSGTPTYHLFDAPPLAASLETGEFQPSPGRYVFVTEASPVMDAETWDAEFTLKSRSGTYAQTVFDTRATAWGGVAPVRGEGKYMAIQMMKPAGSQWRDAQAMQVKFRPAGVR